MCTSLYFRMLLFVYLLELGSRRMLVIMCAIAAGSIELERGSDGKLVRCSPNRRRFRFRERSRLLQQQRGKVVQLTGILLRQGALLKYLLRGEQLYRTTF